jgi:cytoskeletal protein CcmA (bactofilin family)
MAVSEYGLNQRISVWDAKFNLPSQMGGLPVGAVDTTSVYVASQDTARVRLTRITPLMYSVESVGRASIPRPQLQAVRSVVSLVRLAYPEIDIKGALTAASKVTIKGDAKVIGNDSVPDTWSQTQCAPLMGANKPAVAVPKLGEVVVQGNSTTVVGGLLYDPSAADSNTYVRYGTVTWNELVANATVTIPGGSYSPQPTAANGECAYGVNNWGEPLRDAGAVKPCETHFPIVYANGNVTMNGTGRGQGILLVNGDLRLAGSFRWVGLIIARDNVDGAQGTADIYGGVMAANLKVEGFNDANPIAGTQRIQYSKCGLESALRGSAALVRVRDRGWTQVF